MPDKIRYFSIISTLCYLAFISSGCRQTSVTGYLSNSQISEFSAQAAEEIKTDYAAADTSTPGLLEYNRAVDEVGSQAISLPPYAHLQFATIESSEQLSISLPDGHVFISSGLLALLSSNPSAIDSLITHEVGHVVDQDDLQNLSAALGQGNIEEMLAQGRYTDVVNTEIELGKLSYTYQQEGAADNYALALDQKCHFDKSGLASLIRIVGKQPHSPDSSTWDLSHPIGHGRLARVLRQINSNKAEN